jgi:hypothetical protein
LSFENEDNALHSPQRILDRHPGESGTPFLPSPFIDRIDGDVLYRNVVPIRFEMGLKTPVPHGECGISKHSGGEHVPIVFHRVREVVRRRNSVIVRVELQSRDEIQFLSFRFASSD